MSTCTLMVLLSISSMGKANKIIFAVLITLLVASVCFNIRQCSTERATYQDTTHTTFVDTVPFYKPVPKDSVVVRYVTEVLPIVSDTCNIDTINIPENGNIDGDFIRDSVKVAIPISSKVYEDSIYTAYVSGYRASLDSIFVYPRREVITITEKMKPKRWGIGIHAGYGIGKDGLSPYIGIGLSYNFFGF